MMYIVYCFGACVLLYKQILQRTNISISKSKMKLGLFVVKLLGISFVGVLYFWLSVAASYPIDRYVFTNHEQKKKKRIFNEVIKISTQIALLMVIAYLVRNVVDRTHFPLNGLFGYNHLKLKEINGGIIIAFALLVTQYNLKHRITRLFPQQACDPPGLQDRRYAG